ncbi:MAG: sugar phosphate isomerase/epimerase [Acidobacteria bacterium]|nr:sugar phosphate isomerase/epimerase [Acidobacteriota bacterium]
MFNRRQFLSTSLSAAAAVSISGWAERAPIKLAHREGNMLRQSSPYVYELAASIPGLSGVEVQTNRSNLWDRDTVLAYKKAANRWGMRTCSMGGSLPAGESITNPGPAEISLRKTIRSGEILGASVVLVGGFRETCPRMDDESSYGPTVELLKRLGPVAEDAGMILGLELSLGLADYQKLLALVGHPAVRAYWDATGTDHMGHPGDGLKGLEVLGSSICQMHLKNGRKLMEEVHLMEPHPQHPEAGRAMSIDWKKALPIIKASGFDGWLAFETPHASPEACIEETKKNIAFVMKYLA